MDYSEVLSRQAGFTKPGAGYPAYINVQQVQVGVMQITLRSPAGDGGEPGVCATIQMTPDEFRTWLSEIAERVLA